jgi:anti-sigma B factor antagonist
MEMIFETVGNILVVVPDEARLDASVSTAFKGRIVDWVNRGHTHIVLDLSRVDFIDSSGLGVMISILKSTQKMGGLAICGVRDSVMSLFEITRTNRVFKIFDSRAQALKHLSG